ncbi:MAG TPA: FxDxF family PEP-CTERM protein [Methylophilaceae bacterium]|jgi:hypothetical protein
MSLLKILALVIALSTSHSALAKVYALGDISPSSSNSSLSFETDVIYGDTNFLDYFTFRLTSNAATVFGSAPDVTVSVGNGTDSTNIISADLFLEKSAINDLINSDESFAFENISAGTYFFAVSGKHRGTLGGSYTFNLASSESLTTPIPEPSSFALLGLGLLGLLARSKLSDSKG